MEIKELLRQVQAGEMSLEAAEAKLKDLPYEDLHIFQAGDLLPLGLCFLEIGKMYFSCPIFPEKCVFFVLFPLKNVFCSRCKTLKNVVCYF